MRMDSAPRSRKDSILTGLTVVALLLSALPLALYPVVLVANIMSLSAAEAHPSPEAGALRLIPQAFLWMSTAYPVAWLTGVVTSVVMLLKRQVRSSMAAAAVPLAYLVVLAILYGLWMKL